MGERQWWSDGAAGLLETHGDNWHCPCIWPGWWGTSSLDEESPSKPTHLTGELDDAAAQGTVTVEVTVASFFVSLEAAPGVQQCGGEEPAPHAPAPPWLFLPERLYHFIWPKLVWDPRPDFSTVGWARRAQRQNCRSTLASVKRSSRKRQGRQGSAHQA